MTERQIENRVRKLKELESQRKVLEEQEKALKAEIKKDMESKALRVSFPDICEQFTKQSASKRFTIA